MTTLSSRITKLEAALGQAGIERRLNALSIHQQLAAFISRIHKLADLHGVIGMGPTPEANALMIQWKNGRLVG